LYSLPQGKFLVAYCGRLVERKRVDDLINAVQILSGSNIHLVIIGDGPEMGNLRTQSQVIGDDVSFLGGIGDRSSLFNLLGTVDLLVLPSEDEPWGLVVNEAMSMGTPVLVSDQCGCSFDVALVPRSGMVFPTRNVGALAKGITKFMSSVQARKNVIQDSATINSPELSCRELQSMLQNSHSSNNGILIQ
jgi:glycosyltransferase involved in cell wall biosynthesis